MKDSNNNIRILAIAVAIGGECYENRFCFLSKFQESTEFDPSFIISDREKGLQRAVEEVYPRVLHAYCFRHVMENFNSKFRNKKLKGIPWSIAKAHTRIEQEVAIKQMQFEPRAIQWLREIGLKKISLLDSPVCRFGIVTSNNVESINARLLEFREWPILELLIKLERLVVTNRQKQFVLSSNWPSTYRLTDYAEKMLIQILSQF